ncbi:glycoside hydrolase family 20 protein [Exidia glandulosa HHB12029]|uniref:Beta-hexosaminidase n=1 Tax=Exidia glandulosa HHB12029 TaxID=1314781 RepID=A0A165P1H5_EXIGL|nr:glycoside hydrolase family 20 protein [Exidia glandulosa HHB12029]
MIFTSTHIALAVVAGSFPVSAVSLWPVPASLTTGSTILRLAPDFTIALSVSNAPRDLVDAVIRTESHIWNDKHRLMVVDRGASHSAAIAKAPLLPQLNVQLVVRQPVLSIAEETSKEMEKRSEEYTLTVPADGRAALLVANSTLGLLRGLTTFEQLWYTLGPDIYTPSAPVTIHDKPAFPYRGFMLDTARNFYSVEDLKRTFDAMSMVKMSAFHWHVADSQSFPVEVEGYPEIAQKGAYDQELIYTVTDIKDLTAYAAERGIDIIMEIDTPGHSGAIGKAYPEHVACPESRPWGGYAAEPPSGQLRIASPDTVDFTSKMFTALASKMPGKYFSTGGDEVNINCYNQDEATQQQLKATNKTLDEALNTFVQATHTALARQGKIPVVWEEMALSYKVNLFYQTIVMIWISSQSAASVLEKGHRIVQAPSDYLYLDCGAGMWLGTSIGGSWCDPFKSWQRVYDYKPLAGIPEKHKSKVLGGQTCLWSEQSDPANLDSIVWPRTAALAEVLWSPENLLHNSSSALARLHDIRYRMVQRGIRAIALQPHWCAVRPGLCDAGA